MKKFFIYLLILISAFNNSILGQKKQSKVAERQVINWGQFSSYPSKSIIENSSILSDVDAKMLALLLENQRFNPSKYSKVPAFQSYFKDYNKARNEFERQRIAKEIQNKFESRQHELSTIGSFLTSVTGELGEYSFEKEGFPFSILKVGAYVLSWEGNNLVQLTNYVSVYHKYDRAVFPNIIPIDSKNAEKIVNKNPGHRVELLLVIKPDKGDISFLSNGFMPQIVATALYCVIILPTSREVIGVYPSFESLNNEILSRLMQQIKIITDFYNKIEDDPTGIDENAQYRDAYNDIEKQKKRLEELSLSKNNKVDSLDNFLKSEIKKKNQIAKELLFSKGLNSVMYKSFYFGTGNGKIQITSFDGKQFTGSIYWHGNTNRIDGELVEDFLGPKIKITETWSKSRKRIYTIRVKNESLLCGTNDDLGDRGILFINCKQ